MDECKEWIRIPERNPLTRKRIRPYGSEWLKWYDECKDHFSDIDTMLETSETKNYLTSHSPSHLEGRRILRAQRSPSTLKYKEKLRQRHPYFSELPEELKLKVISHLDTSSWGAMRRVSRDSRRIASDKRMMEIHYKEYFENPIHPWLRFALRHKEKFDEFKQLYLHEIFVRKEDRKPRGKFISLRVNRVFNEFQLALLFLYNYTFENGFVYIIPPELFTYRELTGVLYEAIKKIKGDFYPHETKTKLMDESLRNYGLSVESTVNVESVRDAIQTKEMAVDLLTLLLEEYCDFFESYVPVVVHFFNAILTSTVIRYLEREHLEAYARWYGIDTNSRNLQRQIADAQNKITSGLLKYFISNKINGGNFTIPYLLITRFP